MEAFKLGYDEGTHLLSTIMKIVSINLQLQSSWFQKAGVGQNKFASYDHHIGVSDIFGKDYDHHHHHHHHNPPHDHHGCWPDVICTCQL